MKRLSIIAAISIAFILLPLTACDELFDFDFDWGDYRYSFRDGISEDMEGIDKVSVTIVNGYVEIDTGSDATLEIDIEERIKAPNENEAEELADQIDVVARRVGSEMIVEIDYGDAYHLRKHFACNLEIDLPARVDLEVETTNGKIVIAKMEGNVHAETTNGSIELDACGRDAELGSTNGRITVGAVGGDIETWTTNGGITIDEAAGDVRASTTNGGIECRLDLQRGCTITASTTNGRISDSLPSGFDAEYNRRRTHLDGRYGDGGNRIQLRTTNGSIRISGN